MKVLIEALKQEDACALLAFESKNREFFERTVPSRGEAYYQDEHFQESLQALLAEQAEGTAFLSLIKSEQGIILGRMNLVDIDQKRASAELGYRVGEEAAGKGVASSALGLLLGEYVQQLGIREVHAKTTADNIASQKVLLKNGFVFQQADAQGFLHYHWTLQV
ncbi:GNAT family N-acetyltransferase [Brevibacillus parabrevis]|uniref:GNAT family N-acetyltransferase n=1 Tax=Brevibacillus parabrevis TaxID=54914 RepID=UPI0028D017E5|nr:GNAT family N-acetyltransferase [Brevibacillus parabrevis]MED1725120.1 GNAT family N-acetyltransferase [Brevibacillus parabrevis]